MSIRNMWRAAIITGLLGSVVFTGACSKQVGGTLPTSNEVSGWARTGEVRTFEPSNLYQYIDGDAERYIKAGVKSTSTGDYKFQDRIEAVADVYMMSNADGAKQIFESEPAGEAKSIQLGDAGRASGQSVTFRKGRHLVRLVAYQDAPDTQQALMNLGRGIESKLSQ